jgi:hypothetical protein
VPAPLSDQNRKMARKRAKDEFGVEPGALYIEADDQRWGPVACVPHRTHPDREIVTDIRNAQTGQVERFGEPDVHETGQEHMGVTPDDGETTYAAHRDQGYPGYQPDCDLCADQVFDTFDHVLRVRAEQERVA